VGIVDKVKSFFKRGGVRMGMGKELGTPLDHPKINISPDEYARIEETFKLYSNQITTIKYFNSKRVEKERPYMTLNMIKEVSNLLAKIVFNEKCEITIADKLANKYIKEVFAQNDFHKRFSEYLEPMFALGGLVVRPYMDEHYNIKLSWCLATTFYPLKSNTNEIDEGALVTKTRVTEKDKTIYYTLFEFHEKKGDGYQITNELYRSEKSNLVGQEVPLSRLDEYKKLKETAHIKGLLKPLFAYLKPAGFNNVTPSSPLGLGVCDNSKPTLKQINDTYDNFGWEYKMGKRKIAIPEWMTTVKPDEGGVLKQTIDDETDLFLIMNGILDGSMPVDLTSDIRTQAYIDGINFFFRTLEMQTKLSSGTFTFDGNSVKTATEVISEDSQTYKTRNSHITEIEAFLRHLIISILELASKAKGRKGTLYTGKIPTEDEIGIDFDDGVFQSKEALLKHYSHGTLNKLIPRKEALQRIWDIPEDEAEKWLKMMVLEDKMFSPEYEQIRKEIELGAGSEI